MPASPVASAAASHTSRKLIQLSLAKHPRGSKQNPGQHPRGLLTFNFKGKLSFPTEHHNLHVPHNLDFCSVSFFNVIYIYIYTISKRSLNLIARLFHLRILTAHNWILPTIWCSSTNIFKPRPARQRTYGCRSVDISDHWQTEVREDGGEAEQDPRHRLQVRLDPLSIGSIGVPSHVCHFCAKQKSALQGTAGHQDDVTTKRHQSYVYS